MGKSRKKVNTKIFIIVGGIILLFFLTMDLNTRLSELNKMNSQLDEIKTQVCVMQITKQVLHTQLAYATSEVAVEDWAREDAHMHRPGDIVVVPLASVEVTQTPQVIPTPTPIPITNRDIWQELFFGD